MLLLLILCCLQAWLRGLLAVLARSFLLLFYTFFGEEYKPAEIWDALWKCLQLF